MLRIIIAIILLVSIHTPIKAQLLVSNNISLTVNTGAQLTVKGDMLIAAGSTITNNGKIDLSGNWINNSGSNCFGLSAGTVELNGAVQSIGGSDETAFNNLVLVNGSKTQLIDATTGGVMATPGGVLTLNSAGLDLNSHRLLVTNSSPAAIVSNDGFIISEDSDHSSTVVWRIGNSPGNHVIPFGTIAGEIIPFGIEVTSGISGDMTVSTYPASPANTPYPVTPTPVTHIRNIFGFDNAANTVDRFWEVGTTGTPLTTLTFSYAAAEIAANGNAGVLGQRWNFTDDAWESPLPGQFNPTVMSVSVPGVSQFGPWALAISGSPLPIELLKFDARAIDDDEVICEWQTATEINNDYFTIERSADGVNFENIGTIAGAGNSNSTLSYEFTDRDPYKRLSWYRLKQTDFDGAFSYSENKKVYLHELGKISVYPNPSSGLFYLQLSGDDYDADDLVFEIYDMGGRKVYYAKIASLPPDGYGIYQVNAGHLSPSLYHFRVISTSGVESQGKLEIF